MVEHGSSKAWRSRGRWLAEDAIKPWHTNRGCSLAILTSWRRRGGRIDLYRALGGEAARLR
jgi:hypothetical protein